MPTTAKQEESRGKGTTISRTSILILAGYLIGVASAQTLIPALQPYVFFTGVCGLIAFIGLDAVAQRLRHDAA